MDFSFVAQLAPEPQPTAPPEPAADRVPENMGCRTCHEARVDRLQIDEDDGVKCLTCGAFYNLTGFDAEIDLALVSASVLAERRHFNGADMPMVRLSAGFDASPRLLGAIAHRIASEAEVLTGPAEEWLVRTGDGLVWLELAEGTLAELQRGLVLLQRAVAKVMR